MATEITLATSWNELEWNQLEAIALLMHQRGDYPPNDLEADYVLYAKIVHELFRCVPARKRRRVLRELHPKDFAAFTQFLFEPMSRSKFLPQIHHHGRSYYGPIDRIQNLTMGEFSYADSLFYRFKTTGQWAYLKLLCGCLYRPKGEGSKVLDQRCAFNKIFAQQNAERLIDLNPATQLAIAAAYEGSRNHLVSLYPRVFPKPKTRDLSQENTPPPPTPKYTPFGALILAKIDYDPAKLQQVENLSVYAFFNLYQTELQALAKSQKP